MRTSEQINELAKALSLAQGQLKSAPKDSVNPFFKSNYADLTSVVESAKDALSKNGLSIIQGAKKIEDGSWVMVTRLCHSSGQWIESDYPILSKDQTSQGFGSGITYSRRYSYQSIAGITAGDDDDGEVSVGRSNHPKVDKSNQELSPFDRMPAEDLIKSVAPKPTSMPQNPVAPKITGPKGQSGVEYNPMSDARLKRLYAISKTSGWAEQEVNALIKAHYNKTSRKDLNSLEYTEVCKYIEGTPPPSMTDDVML